MFFVSDAVIRDQEPQFEVLVLFVVAAFAPKVGQKFAERK